MPIKNDLRHLFDLPDVSLSLFTTHLISTKPGHDDKSRL